MVVEVGRAGLDHRPPHPPPPASVSVRGESDYLHSQIFPRRHGGPRTLPASSPTSGVEHAFRRGWRMKERRGPSPPLTSCLLAAVNFGEKRCER